jgi:hypothetical protein
MYSPSGVGGAKKRKSQNFEHPHSITPSTNNQEPTTNNQEPRTDNQEPRTDNQEPNCIFGRKNRKITPNVFETNNQITELTNQHT